MDIKEDIWNLFKKIEHKGASASGVPEYIIVGLGNPGKEYESTHHNTGFLALDHIASKLSIKINKVKFKAYTQTARIGGHTVLLMKPTTYMNVSGEAVSAAMDFYKVPLENVIVVFDDTTLPLGKMRIRKKGSAGGHNGIKSIINLCGGDAFPRIKIGIGEKPEGWDLADWVLSKYTEEDLKTLDAVFENTFSALSLIMDGKAEEAMGKFN